MHNNSMEYCHYLHTQMKLEGIVPGLDGFFQIRDPQQEEQPWVILARLANGEELAYIYQDLPAEIGDGLRKKELNFHSSDWILHFLGKHGLSARSSRFKTYIVPNSFLQASMQGVRVHSGTDVCVQEFGFGGLSDQVYAIEERGKILAACVSVREDNACAEAWVYTAPDQRGKGLARRVTTAWGRAILESGRVAFYSHKVDNLASAGLADRLGLHEVFQEVGVERV